MCVTSLCTRGALDTWSRGRSTAALGGEPYWIALVMEQRQTQQARHLLQLGLALFLLALLVGIFVPYFAVPRLALSVHLLGVLQGTFLVAVSGAWSRLGFGRTTSRLVFW